MRLIFWIVFLTVCAVATILGTLLWKRPMVAAISVSAMAGIMVGLHDADTSAFWGLAMIISAVCSLPATVVTAIVTENLMDKYAAHWKD